MFKLFRLCSPGTWCLLGVLLCIAMMAVALLLQYVGGLEPCPLCVFQRVAVIATFIVLLPGAIFRPKRWEGSIYGILGVITSAMGVGVAARHLWLQSLPPDAIPSCGPGIDYLFQALPIHSAISYVLAGSGVCAEIHGIWLGITLPGWTMIGFAVLMLISLFATVKAFRYPQ